MSLEAFNRLDDETKKIFKQSAQEAAEYERQWVADKEAGQLEAIKSHGVEVVENPDVAYPQYSEYITKIQAELAK